MAFSYIKAVFRDICRSRQGDQEESPRSEALPLLFGIVIKRDDNYHELVYESLLEDPVARPSGRHVSYNWPPPHLKCWNDT